VRIKVSISKAAKAVYGAYAWAALLSCVCVLCIFLAVLPRLRGRRRAARWAARQFFLLIGRPVRRLGHELPGRACIVVANHSSYLDGVILTAALPPDFTFLIKQEMAFMPVASFVLKRLGSRFVDRADARHRQEILRGLVAAARSGDALAVFPEGTFDGEPGLKPFQLGAFAAAAKAELPIVPVVIFGSRQKLPSGRLLASPGALAVRICEPIHAERRESTKRLMHAARQRMLAHLPEPDLGQVPFEAPASMQMQAETDRRAEAPAA
jgi:1-acyl-sn-glycerol-3-phosphate acyltransferase